MLAQYQTRTAQLLQNPAAPTTLYATSDLTSFINQARMQLAGEAACVRIQGTLALAQGQQVYPFSSIVLGNSAVGGIFNIMTMWLAIGGGLVWVRPRPFPWFSLYELNNPVPVQAQPTIWSQYAQGETGSLYVSNVPDTSYTATLDCVCVPIPLVDDTTVEAIPFPFTDAVAYFAAYLALLGAQTGAREAEANRMFQRYQEFYNRARRFSTPEILPNIYSQQQSPVRSNQLGLGGQGQGGGGQG